MSIPNFPSTVATKDEIRGTIDRSIMINVKIEGMECPVCELDPITNTSSDSFCVTCSGLYWINTTSGYSINAHVRWLNLDQPSYTEGGVIDQGDCIATVKYTSETLYNIQNSESFIIDDMDLYLKKYVLRGVPSPDRIRIILKEDSE